VSGLRTASARGREARDAKASLRHHARRQARATAPALTRQQRVYSVLLHVVMLLMVAYCLLPLVWLAISATKTQSGLHTSPGLWFADDEHGGFRLWTNLVGTFTASDGIYTRWLLNTIFYAVVAGLGSSIIATLAGYAVATMRFPGRNLLLTVTIAFMTIPATVITIPLFLMYARAGLVNTPAAVIVPQLSNPFGLYLMIIFARASIPPELLESAKIDGAGHWRTFWKIAMPLLSPGFVTVLLFALVGAWNNYMLPLVMLSGQENFPLTVGLRMWLRLAASSAAYSGTTIGTLTNFIITGSLVAIVPIIISFCFLQKYWQSGLAAGSVKQ
jgi:multiple sugar transport system permease protein